MKDHTHIQHIGSKIEDFIAKVAVKDPSDEEVEAISSSLKELDDVVISRELLQATKIGAILTKLYRSPCEKIDLLKVSATKLTTKWKEQIRQKNVATPGVTNEPKKRQRTDKATTDADDGSAYEYSIHNHVIRDKALQYLYKAFLSECDDSFDCKRVGKLVYDIECGLFDEYLMNSSTQKEYTQKLKSIAFNLKDPKNHTFRKKIYNGDIEASSVAKMESAEMASDEKKMERNNILQESLEACQSDWAVKNILMSKDGKKKGQFKCFKCYSSDTVYYQMQTRSSDEPMTTFVTCLQCNNRWKF